MVHEKDLKSSKDDPPCMKAAALGGGADAAPTTAAPQRGQPAPPTTVWPWWAHMDPSYPDALLAFLEMRLRRKYLQERRPQRSLINDGTQTDDVSRSPVDDDSMKPLDNPKHLTSETSNAQSARQLKSPKRLSDEPCGAQSVRPLESPKHLTGESSDAHSSRPIESPKYLTNDKSNANIAKQLKCLKQLANDPSDAHSVRPLASPKHLTPESSDAHSSRPVESPKYLTNDKSNSNSAKQLKCLKQLADNPSDAHSLRPLENPKHLTSESSDAHSSRPIESSKYLTNDKSNTNSAKQLNCQKHLTDEPSDAHCLRPLESPKHLTSESSDAHSSRPTESPIYLPNDKSNTNSAKQLKCLNQLTDESSDTHSVRPLESPKHLTNESPDAHSSRPPESPKYLTNEKSNAHCIKQLKFLRQLTGESSGAHSVRPLEIPKQLNNEPSNTLSMRQPKSLKQLTDEPLDAHSVKPLQSQKQLTNEPSDAHSSSPLDSLTFLTNEKSNAHSAKLLKYLEQLTDELSDAHTVRPFESPKYHTSERFSTHNCTRHQSTKFLSNDWPNAQCLRQLRNPKHITIDASSDHRLCRPRSPKHLISESCHLRPLGQHYSSFIKELSEKLHDGRHSSSQEDQKTISNRATSVCAHSSQSGHSTPNQQALIQKSTASMNILDQWQEMQRAPFVFSTTEAMQSPICTVSSHFSTSRTFSMRGGEWYVEQESTSKVKPNTEEIRNYPSNDHNIDQMLISKALNPKPQSIFQKLFRFQSKSSVNTDASIKYSLPFDGQSTARTDFKLDGSMCKIPSEKTCTNDCLKVDQDLLVYTFKEADKGSFYRDFSKGRKYMRGTDVSHRNSHSRLKKSFEDLRCIYFNRAPSYASIVDDTFYESDSTSSEINLFFTTMNFGTAFTDAESSSESASSSYSPRRTKDREECIDLRNALASESENENQRIEKTGDVTRKENVPRTRCQHSSVRPFLFSNEQRASVGTVMARTAVTPGNYCGIHDTTRERFEIEFLKKAVIKLFDMNPEQLKGDSKNFATLMESPAASTPSTSRKSTARSPRTPRTTKRKTTQSRTTETSEGVFVRVWRNIVRLVQRKRTPDSNQPAGNEQTVRASCATLSSGKSGRKASELKDRDASIGGTFTPRVATLAPIDEVPETTTSASSAVGAGPSSTELSTSSRRKT